MLKKPLTQKQFQLLAKIARLREGPAQEAAKLILVEGYSVSESAERSGCTVQSASNTHRRCLASLELINQMMELNDGISL